MKPYPTGKDKRNLKDFQTILSDETNFKFINK